MIVRICYFLKSIKSVFILVQRNTSLSKNYVARSIMCDRLNFRKKNRFVCAVLFSVHMINRRTRTFHEFAFDNKALKTFFEFRTYSKLERC